MTEGPWIVSGGGGVRYLFYSGNGYASEVPCGKNNASSCCLYSVGVARSKSGILGPYVKRGAPILSTAQNPEPPFTGPGHCSVVRWGSSGFAMVYHAWSSGSVGGGYPRHMLVDEVVFGRGRGGGGGRDDDDDDGWPIVDPKTPGLPSWTQRVGPPKNVPYIS